ncbi:hypothetical protein K8T06_14135 [bacterium]|nr:hypothetical protein [bacterium]
MKTSAVCFLILLLLIMPSYAGAMDIRCSNRFLGNICFMPGDDTFLERSEEAHTALENRLLILGEQGGSTGYEIHVVTTLDYATKRLQMDPATAFASKESSSAGAFRHSDLKWDWKEVDAEGEAVKGFTDIDRLNIYWNTSRTALTVGRQAIGLSTCLYLTINDFFQPFAPEAIYREYKPGVDALKFQYYTGPLSEIDMIYVAGYHDSDDLNWDESAMIGRTVFSAKGYEWNIMAGKLPRYWMVAGSLQGEIGRFGVRAEFNVDFREGNLLAAGGIDYRFENSLHIFSEYLYCDNRDMEYMDYQNHLALAATYQWHPLMISQIFGIANLDDESALFSAVLTYSLADEADFILGGYYAVGSEPCLVNGVPEIPTQYGAVPDSIYVELKFYF